MKRAGADDSDAVRGVIVAQPTVLSAPAPAMKVGSQAVASNASTALEARAGVASRGPRRANVLVSVPGLEV